MDDRTMKIDLSIVEFIGHCDKIQKCYREKDETIEDSFDDSVDSAEECDDDGGECIDDRNKKLDMTVWQYLGHCDMYRNCYRKKGTKPKDDSSDETKWCSWSKPQLCKMRCATPVCDDDDDCAVRGPAQCCDYKCKDDDSDDDKPNTDTKKPWRPDDDDSDDRTEWCPNSPIQLCKMICPEPKCDDDKCARRTGNCCNYLCGNM